MPEPKITPRWTRALAGLTLAAGCSAAGAAAFTSNLLFTANDRSIWSAGPGFTLDTGPRFFGTDWQLGDSVGDITELCAPFIGCAKAGAKLGAETSGRVGFAYGAKVNSGTFDLNLPVGVTFTTPTAISGQTIGSVPLAASVTPLQALLALNQPLGQPQVRNASLQVTAPTVQAYLDLVAELHAFAGATVCVVVCYGPSIGPIDFNQSRELAAINRNNDGQLRLLGNAVSANQSISALGGLVNTTLQLPHLDSSSLQTPGGRVGGVLTSSQRDNVATVGANLAQIGANAAGLPIPLSGRLGPIGYNLLQTDAALSLDIQQTLTFTPELLGRYVFSSTVVPTINGVTGAATQVVDFHFGDDVSFAPGQVGQIAYQPFVTLGGTVRNQTDLVLRGDVLTRALGVDVAGLDLGPLVNEGVSVADLGRINLIDTTFSQSFGSIGVAPITLDFVNCRSGNFGSSEFPLFGICASSGYFTSDVVPQGDGTFVDLFDIFSCSGHRPGAPPTCFQGPAGSTSAYYDADFSRVYINDGSALSFSPVTVGAGSSDELQLGALGAVGFNGATPFVIPEGAPLSDFAVPEPGMLALLGLALLGLASRRPGRSTPVTGPRRTRRMTAVIGLALPLAATAPAWAADPPPAWAYPVNPPGFKPAPDDGTPRRVPGSQATYTLSQVRDRFVAPDWHPGDHPPMPEVVARGRKPGVFACGYCHRADGPGGPENASIAGLPEAYILRQMADFRSGARQSAVPQRAPVQLKASLVKDVSDAELAEAARYFASLKPRAHIKVVETDRAPRTSVAGWVHVLDRPGETEALDGRIVEVPEDAELFESRDARARFVAYVPIGSVQRGAALAAGGRTPACASCHGAGLRGLGDVPSIAGRSPSYLMRQLVDMQLGTRAGSGVAPMKPVADALSRDEMTALAAYLASLPP